MEDIEYRKFVKRNARGIFIFWEIGVYENKIITKSYQEDGKVKGPFARECVGKNIGKANETTSHEQAKLEAQSLIYKKIRENDYIEVFDDNDLEDVMNMTEKVLNISPMLLNTAKLKESWVKDGAYVQPKLDGKRCIAYFKNDKWICQSRNKKEYKFLHNIKNYLDAYFDKKIIYDGELLLPGKNIQELSEIVTVNQKKAHENEYKIIYNIFDIVDFHLNQEERLNELEKQFMKITKESPLDFVKVIEVNNWDDILKEHKKYVKDGYEGTVCRYKYGKYVSKRSQHILKIKDFNEDEFKVIDCDEGKGKNKGMAVWICKTKEGNEFNCISAVPDEIKRMYYKKRDKYIGKYLTVKFQGYTDNGIPRFPVGLIFRDDL